MIGKRITSGSLKTKQNKQEKKELRPALSDDFKVHFQAIPKLFFD